jgi:glycosyltransferase involved in cell wall biosynthesis
MPAQTDRWRQTVLMYEPHPAGHAHYYYSSSLARAMARLTNSPWQVELLTSRGNDAGSDDVVRHAVIDPLRPLSAYRFRMVGAIDRCLRWGYRDRQIAASARNCAPVAGIHYQAAFGLPTINEVRKLRAAGVRTLLTVHNVRPHAARWWEPAPLRSTIDRAQYRCFDALLLHSDGLRREMDEFIGAGGPQRYVVPHGVGTAVTPPAPLAERMREKKLLFVGAPRPNKGLAVLLAALRDLPEYSLTLAGYHSLDEYRRTVLDPLIVEARSHGCRIAILGGFLTDTQLDTVMRSHSAVVLPYLDFSAQSGVLSQAVQYRLPVVATDAGALGDMLRTYRFGTLVPPADPAGLAAGIRRLANIGPELLSAGLDMAARACSWERTAEATRCVYDEVFACGGVLND